MGTRRSEPRALKSAFFRIYSVEAGWRRRNAARDARPAPNSADTTVAGSGAAAGPPAAVGGDGLLTTTDPGGGVGLLPTGGGGGGLMIGGVTGGGAGTTPMGGGGVGIGGGGGDGGLAIGGVTGGGVGMVPMGGVGLLPTGGTGGVGIGGGGGSGTWAFAGRTVDAQSSKSAKNRLRSIFMTILQGDGRRGERRDAVLSDSSCTRRRGGPYHNRGLRDKTRVPRSNRRGSRAGSNCARRPRLFAPG